MASKKRGSANTNATTEMMVEMKKMFEEKIQALEMENNILKEKAGKFVYSRTERNSMSQSRKTKNESKIKIVESSCRNP